MTPRSAGQRGAPIVAAAVALVAVAAAMALAGCTRNGEASLVGYRVGQDPRDLVLVVEAGPGDTVLPPEDVEEEDDAVHVEVRVRRAREEAQPLVAVRQEVTVRLSQPLGDRRVESGRGHSLPTVSPS